MGSEDARVIRAVGDHFRRARETLGWTLSDVVERASKEGARFSVANLSRFERGLAEFSFTDAYAIARALGTPLSYLEEVIRAAQTRQDVDITGRSYEELFADGARLVKLGEVAAGTSFLEAAQDLLLLEENRADRDECLATVLIATADAHTRMRHFALASELAARVLRLEKISPDKQALALLRLVSVYYLTGDFRRSRVYAAEAKKLMPSVQERTQALANTYFGSLELKEEYWDKAIPFFDGAAEYFVKADDTINLLVCRASVGYCLARRGQVAEGVRLLEFVVDQAAERSYNSVAARGLRLLGELLTNTGEYARARAHLESAAGISRNLGAVDDLFMAWFRIWKLEISCGTPQKARAASATLTRLLRKADSRLPEAKEFVAHCSSEQSGRSR